MTDLHFPEFFSLCSFVKYFYLVFKDPKYRIVYLFLTATFSFHILSLSLNATFEMFFSNLILRSKAPSMKNSHSFLRSKWALLLSWGFQHVSMLRAVYSPNLFWSLASPRQNRRLMCMSFPASDKRKYL